MNTGTISYNERVADNVCFSFPGVLSVVPERFSLPAPDLNFDPWISVSSGIHAGLQFIQDRLEHFCISVAGLFRTVDQKRIRTGPACCKRAISALRIRILKLSYAGRRL